MIIKTIHKVDLKSEHANQVRQYMIANGAPTIRAIDLGDDEYAAVEGSHRVAIAHELGLIPEIQIIDLEDEIEHDVEDVPSKIAQDVYDYAYCGAPDLDRIAGLLDFRF